MEQLFRPERVKGLTIKNRLVMAPMCMYQAKEDGFATPWHTTHYATRASGGIGLILVEATAVEPRGRITMNDLGIWEDAHIPHLKGLVESVHAHGATIGIQLAHAGRKSGVTNASIIGPSTIRFSDRYQHPQEMTERDIEQVVEAFKEGARRANEAGFDAIEIHGAHGYLINQFLSPLSNKRTDRYGGSLANRLRFLEEIIAAIQTVWPKEKPLLLRLSAEEYHEDGHHVEETIEVVKRLKHSIDLFNISSGGVVLTEIHAYPGYQLLFSEAVKRETGAKTIGGGLITSASEIKQILESAQADFVYLGRLLLRDPYFALGIAKESGREDLIPTPYQRGFK